MSEVYILKRIDGPLFRSQRELLAKLGQAAEHRQAFQLGSSELDLLHGLICLTDAIADQAHDTHGIDCLLDGDSRQDGSHASEPVIGESKRFVLYDFDADELASTTAYVTYDLAADDATELDNVVIVPLVVHEVICGEAQEDDGPCDCEQPGQFCSGVPGILAHVENGRLVEGASVERCDQCQRYPSDEAAFAKLAELGIA